MKQTRSEIRALAAHGWSLGRVLVTRARTAASWTRTSRPGGTTMTDLDHLLRARLAQQLLFVDDALKPAIEQAVIPHQGVGARQPAGWTSSGPPPSDAHWSYARDATVPGDSGVAIPP